MQITFPDRSNWAETRGRWYDAEKEYACCTSYTFTGWIVLYSHAKYKTHNTVLHDRPSLLIQWARVEGQTKQTLPKQFAVLNVANILRYDLLGTCSRVSRCWHVNVLISYFHGNWVIKFVLVTINNNDNMNNN